MSKNTTNNGTLYNHSMLVCPHVLKPNQKIHHYSTSSLNLDMHIFQTNVN